MLVYTLLTLLVLRFIQRLAVPRWAAERQSSDAVRLYRRAHQRRRRDRAAGAESYVMRKLYEYMRLYPQDPPAVVFSSLTYNLTNLVYVLGIRPDCVR